MTLFKYLPDCDCGAAYDVVVQINSIGVRQFKHRCQGCGKVAGRAMPYDRVSSSDMAAAEVVHRSPAKQYEPCSYRGCKRTPTEEHHVAPRVQFGDEADMYPTIFLCVPHHRNIHTKLNTPGFEQMSRPSPRSIALAKKQLGAYWDERAITMATG